MQPRLAPRRLPALRPLALGLAGLGLVASAVAAEPVELAPVQIIGTTPVPGIGLPRDQIPANVQTLDGARLQDGGGPALAESLQRSLPSVTVNEIQGNPYQADLNYRGFSASPLLGTPQGISVFLDGVRMNEGFGDVVNWDVIPQRAIASLTLVPGSNPLYGLNTLGGAIALQTKRGDTHPGGEAELYGGSFDRWGGAIQHGGKREALSWYLAAEGMDEDGWREHSSTEVAQYFGKFAWTTAKTDLALTLAHADTDLIGNGLVPDSLMRSEDRDAIFTHPDQTRNRTFLAALNGSHWLSDHDQLSATTYLRRTRSRTLNGDGNDEYEEWIDGGMVGEEPENGVLNRTATDQHAYGLALQWSRVSGAHQLAVGAAHDRSQASFRQTEQGGELTDDRGIEAEEAIEPVNSLLGETRTTSLYFTDTWSLARDLQLTGSLRYNHTHVINRDRRGDALNGDFTYNKVNPALGFTWQASPAVTLYGGFTQGNRAPTPIELGCADPENPCSLPNAMAADPFLDQVVTRTWELGARGRLPGKLAWNATAFHSTNHDDILFVGTGGSLGYFTNFGETRRQGLELGLEGEHGTVEWRASYSYLWATFQSSACLLAENNSSEGEGGCPDDEIRVDKGDRLPGLPRHAFKLALTWRPMDALRLGADLLAYSGQTVRGNENERHAGDDGELPGYGVVNVRADYRLPGGWSIFGRVDNLFDQDYATGGALAENPFVGAGNAFDPDPENWRSERFVAPGAPLGGWVGVRYAWK
jgi:outer membrane receptor protein involved in Fe transport